MTDVLRNLQLHYLRGIAILLVVAYHAGVPGFNGGYIGVDIFFLLSGYLIASKLMNVKDAQNIKRFYIRRILKIYPSLFFVVALTLYAFIWLNGWTPVNQIYITEAAASLLGIVNVGFAEYAVAESFATSPFLHLWSIAIELQFYIFAPLIAYFVLKNPTTNLKILFGSLIVISFTFFLVATYLDALFAYYASASRIWEFTLGAAIFYLLQINPNLLSQITNNRAFKTSLVLLIVLYTAGYNILIPNSPIYGVFPILAAALIIGISHNVTYGLVERSKTAMVLDTSLKFLANISYPLYLVHYPVMFFSNAYYPEHILTAIVFSILLGYLIHKTIETPFLNFRRQHNIGNKN